MIVFGYNRIFIANINLKIKKGKRHLVWGWRTFGRGCLLFWFKNWSQYHCDIFLYLSHWNSNRNFNISQKFSSIYNKQNLFCVNPNFKIIHKFLQIFILYFKKKKTRSFINLNNLQIIELNSRLVPCWLIYAEINKLAFWYCVAIKSFTSL